jgi:[ribosomal protein S5]-alanine N-acetyltransferase
VYARGWRNESIVVKMGIMIKTKRLLLRGARLDDATEMHKILSNPEAMLYWSTPPHSELAQTQAWIADMVAATANGREDFIIEVDGRLAGKVGAYRLPEFGYILHPDFWGQGIATEATTAFLRHIYHSRPDIVALSTDIDPRNSASIQLIKKLGFRETGRAERTWETHIGWCDSVYFAIDRAAMAGFAATPS